MTLEPPPGSICRDRLGQAWHHRTDQPHGWQRGGSGSITQWDEIPRDLRDSFELLVRDIFPHRPTWQFTGSPALVFGVDDRLYTLAEDGHVVWASERDKALATALVRLALNRLEAE